MKRAFEVSVQDWPEVTAIYAAESAAKAKYQAWSAAYEAGYYTIKFGKLKVRREPKFDPIVDRIKHGVDRTCANLWLQELAKV